MAAPTASEPILDLTILRQQFGDDDDLLCEVICDYRAQRIEITAHIRRALASGELGAAADHTHQLRGSLLALGAQVAASAASELEVVSRRGDAAAAAAALPIFEAALDTLAPVLDQLVADIQGATA